MDNKQEERQKLKHRLSERQRYIVLMQQLDRICRMVPGCKNEDKKLEKLRKIIMYTRYLHYYSCNLRGRSSKRFTNYESFLFHEESPLKDTAIPSKCRKKANVIFLGNDIPRQKSFTAHSVTTDAPSGNRDVRSIANDAAYSVAKERESNSAAKRIYTKLVYDFNSRFFKKQHEVPKMPKFTDEHCEEESVLAHSAEMSCANTNLAVNASKTSVDECGITPSCFKANTKHQNNNKDDDDDEYVCIELENFPFVKMDEQSLKQTVTCVKNSLEASSASVLEVKSEELDWDAVTFRHADFQAVGDAVFCAVCHSVANVTKGLRSSWYKISDQYICNNCYKNRHSLSVDLMELMQICDV